MDYDAAPETIQSADGTTTLRRYHVEGHIYAPDRASAQARLDESRLYLDTARLIDDTPETGWQMGTFANDTGEVDNKTPRPCETAPPGTGSICRCDYDCDNYWIRAKTR
jgi:hypothetical protein